MARPKYPSYDNEDIPEEIPPRDNCHMLVMIRVVDDELGVHYLPAVARKWTPTHVMVSISGAGLSGADLPVWLRLDDVGRALYADQTWWRPTRDRPSPIRRWGRRG